MSKSKLTELIDSLRGELMSGAYPPGSRFPSEYRIAEKYNINKTTANKAVSALVFEGLLTRAGRGSGTFVKQLQSFPVNQFVYIGSVQHPYYASLVHGLQQAALTHHCLLSIVAPAPDQLSYFLSKLHTTKISGIFSCNYGYINAAPIPVLYLEEENIAQPDLNNHHYVTCDSYQGAYQIMHEVLKRHHRDIVIPFHIGCTPGRLQGFYAAMQEAGIRDVEERTFWIYDKHSSFVGQRILQKMLQQYPGLTAIVAASDDDIFMIIKAAEQLGIPWRGKIAMTGFGNVTGISDMLPIATVDQHPQLIGQEAVQAMQRIIANPKLTIQEHLNTELVGLEYLPILSAR
ncbi:MAG: HTH-type transcriptional repressor PurR [Lentisphaerae bacterium ADurb.Bin082]|nr:MAG: HTH-type transcriptional repressor PurR [Lentisphaerae bacterium ADurb.Bin082]